MKEKICPMHPWNRWIMKCTGVNEVAFDSFNILDSFFTKLLVHIDKVPNEIQMVGVIFNNKLILFI